ncbi:MAG: hypothetical protein M0C28_18365 [Candidatus Moduliflexus flocculans]|nr:hypothetical protein [Candidatus Moduliflexus flocculans]
MMIFLATTVIANIANFKPEIIQYYLDFIPGEGLVASSKVLFTLPFGILVACFLLLSAGAHALISIPKKTNAIYNADLAQGISKFRWFRIRPLVLQRLHRPDLDPVRRVRHRHARPHLRRQRFDEPLRSRHGAVRTSGKTRASSTGGRSSGVPSPASRRGVRHHPLHVGRLERRRERRPDGSSGRSSSPTSSPSTPSR